MRINKKPETTGNNQILHNYGQNYADHHDTQDGYQSLSQSLEDFNEFDYLMQDNNVGFDTMSTMDENSLQQLYDQNYPTEYGQHGNMHSYPDFPDETQYYNNDSYEQQQQREVPATSTTETIPDEDILTNIVRQVIIEPDQSSQPSSEDAAASKPNPRKRKSESAEPQSTYIPTSSSISRSEYERLTTNAVEGQGQPDAEDLTPKNKKNAIQARINRQRKKNELQSLESRVSSLLSVNATLTSDNARLSEEHGAMSEELQYLRNVLRNQSKISDVIRGIGAVTQVAVSYKYNSMTGTKQQDTSRVLDAMGAGVCIHVDNRSLGDVVSLQFCKECSKMAQVHPTAGSTPIPTAPAAPTS